MVKKSKACLNCKTIFEGEVCPNCGGTKFSENFKGRVYIFNPEKSEIANNMKINKEGEFAIKAR